MSKEHAKFIPREASVETRLLADYLSKLEPDDVATWDQLSEIAGANCHPGGAAYGKLCSARRRVLSDPGYVFITINTVGLKRSTEHEKPGLMADNVEKLRRVARRAIKIGATIDPSQLTNEEKTQFNLRASMLGAVVQFTGTKSTRAIESAVKTAEAQLPLTKSLEATLEVFK